MSRVLSVPDLRAGAKEMLPAAFALIPFGLVCGVAAAGAGASPWEALGLSGIVFSGAAQILATQLLGTGAPLAVIVLACLVVGLRLVMYSAAMAPHFAALPPRWRNALAFLLTDQAFAASVRKFEAAGDVRHAASYFLGCGGVLWGGWQLTNLAGYFAGNVIPAAWSLDFAVPLVFIALLAPLFRERAMVAAGLAAGVAVIVLADLPMRLGIVAAGLVGIGVGVATELAFGRARA